MAASTGWLKSLFHAEICCGEDVVQTLERVCTWVGYPKTSRVDNGSEFLDFEALEASEFSKQQRTRIFYAHPYASWERGSNENGNRMIRRFVTKGRDIARFTRQAISDIETWINNYPRRILDFTTPSELFAEQLKAIA